MKTPTLIVRLCGIYMLTSGSAALLQLHKMNAIAEAAVRQSDPFGYIQLYAWISLVAGVIATAFAGPLAHLLTFDSEPK